MSPSEVARQDAPASAASVLRVMQHEITISPLPPAEYLKTYEQIDPTAPKKLLEAFLNQANHRMSLERADLRARIWLRIAGQLTGFLLVVSMLLVGAYALKVGAAKTACAIFLTTIPFCAIVFVLGKRPSREEGGMAS